MFGSIDTNDSQQRQYLYSSNCSQTNYITSLLTDFEADYYNCNFDSDTNFLDSSEASSPPPTPDIISSFAMLGGEEETPLSPNTPPIYQNLSPPKYSILSPSSTSSSISITSPQNTIQQTRKKLIKDSLRLTIQSRRVALGLEDISNANESSQNGQTEDETTSPDSLLSEVDEERRRRRRERNKVAATKCRNKKKLHSVNLVQESETLEISNAQMKKEISELQKECQQLMNVLNSHQSMCKHSNISHLNDYATFYNSNNNDNYNYYNINLQI